MSATPRLAAQRVLLCVCLLSAPFLFAKGIQGATAYTAGRQPNGIAIADFNGDHRPDIVVIENPNNAPNTTIHVLLTNADGTLQPSIDTAASLNLSGVIAADFNKDGKMDVAVIDSVANTLAIYLGNGDGTFTLKATYATGNQPVSLVSVDLNHDQKLDIVVSNAGDKNIMSFLGAGNGTFTTVGTFSVATTNFLPGAIPGALAAGDLENNGQPDVIVTLQNVNLYAAFEGNGNGTFAPVIYGDILSGSPATAVAMDDLDGDGKLDLVFAGTKVTYFHGRSSVSFQTGLVLDSKGLFGTSIALKDVNGDGYKDIVVSKNATSNITVILNDGHGGFLPGQDYEAPFDPSSVAVADLEGNNKPDIITVANLQYNGGNVQVLHNRGDGSFKGALSFDYQGGLHAATFQTVADFNGDGRPDIVLGDTLVDNTGEFAVLLNTGNFNFSVVPLTSYPVETTASAIYAADIDHDGKMDLIALGQSHISILLGKGDGTFKAPIVIALAVSFIPRNLAIADFNGDGKLDIAFSAASPEDFPNAGPSTFGVIFGNGDGTFQPLQPQNTYDLNNMIAGVFAVDLNHDNKMDIVAMGRFKVGIYLNNGNGTFTQHDVETLPKISEDAFVGFGDFRGLGVTDIVTVKGVTTQPTLQILYNSNQFFTTSASTPLHARPEGIAVGDFDGDGKLDVAVQEDGYLEVFPGLGNGSFGTPSLFGSSAFGIAAVDMNGGGLPDLVGTASNPMIYPNSSGAKMSFQADVNPAKYKQAVTLSATVQASAPNIPAPSGTVTFTDGGTTLGTSQMADGVATQAVPAGFSVGSHSLAAQYSGDDDFFPLKVGAFALPVNKVPTNITLAFASPTVIVGRTISFTATVASTTAGTPGGIAVLHDGPSSIASAQLDAQGQASFGPFVLSQGQHSMSVTHGGDLNFVPSSSSPYSISVIDFTLTAPRSSRTSRSANAGSAKQVFQVQLASSGGQVSGVHLACPALPAGFTCQFTRQDFDLNGPQIIEGTLVQRRAARIRRMPLRSVSVSAAVGSSQRTVTIPLP